MTVLAKYDDICRALTDVRSAAAAKHIRDEAIGMEAYARQAKNKELEADAVEIRMRATRRLDQLRVAQKESVGLATGREGKRRSLGLPENPSDKPTLASQGIDKNLAQQARKLGLLTDDKFEQAVLQVRRAIIKRNILRTIEIEHDRQDYENAVEDGCTVADLDLLVSSGKKFGVVYADPPWSFKVYSGKGKQRSADRYYDTMSIDDIKVLPVEQLAADDAALFLWAVSPDLPAALQVMEAWGFTYKTVGFAWVKQTQDEIGLHWGMGYWTRANLELCLFGTRGSPKRLAKDVHQIIMSPAGAHSRKPEEVNARIERLLAGPYLEMFARRPMKGWTVWGNQITRGLFHQQIPELVV